MAALNRTLSAIRRLWARRRSTKEFHICADCGGKIKSHYTCPWCGAAVCVTLNCPAMSGNLIDVFNDFAKKYAVDTHEGFCLECMLGAD